MNENLTPRQKQFLQRLDDAHQRILVCCERLDEETLCTEPVIGEWTVKDIIGHLVSWDEEFRTEIREILEGQHPGLMRQISGEDDFDAWNQEQIARKKMWSWEQMMADFERDMAEAAELILSLHPEDYRKRGVPAWKKPIVEEPELLRKDDTDSVETLVTFQWRHINAHAKDIERWRRKTIISPKKEKK
jgi:hypothetical protein